MLEEPKINVEAGSVKYLEKGMAAGEGCGYGLFSHSNPGQIEGSILIMIQSTKPATAS